MWKYKIKKWINEKENCLNSSFSFPTHSRIRLFWSLNSLWGRQLMLFLFKRLEIMLMRQRLSRGHMNETSHHHLIRVVFECSNPDKKSHHHFKYHHHHHHHHQIITIIYMRQNDFLSWLKTHIICRLARPVRADWGRVDSWLS